MIIKIRLNFIGFHSYIYQRVKPHWIQQNFGEDKKKAIRHMFEEIVETDRKLV